MKQLSKKVFLFFCLSIFLNCNSDFVNTFKVMNDLRKEFGINSVEISYSKENTIFTLQDIDHTDMSLKDLKDYSVKVDKYLKTKYTKIGALSTRKYLFSGGGGLEIVVFTIDNDENIKITKEY